MVVAATRSVSDSNFCCGKEEWFRLQRPWRQRSSASDSNLRRCIEEWFRLQNGLATASILDFKPRLGNRSSTIVATTMNGPPADGRGGRRRGQDTTKAA